MRKGLLGLLFAVLTISLTLPARAATDEARMAMGLAITKRCLSATQLDKVSLHQIQRGQLNIVYAEPRFTPELWNSPWAGIGREYSGALHRLGICLVTIRWTWDWAKPHDDAEQAFRSLVIAFYSPDQTTAFVSVASDKAVSYRTTKADMRPVLATLEKRSVDLVSMQELLGEKILFAQ